MRGFQKRERVERWRHVRGKRAKVRQKRATNGISAENERTQASVNAAMGGTSIWNQYGKVNLLVLIVYSNSPIPPGPAAGYFLRP